MHPARKPRIIPNSEHTIPVSMVVEAIASNITEGVKVLNLSN
jgi:hypothetical protein